MDVLTVPLQRKTPLFIEDGWWCITRWTVIMMASSVPTVQYTHKRQNVNWFSLGEEYTQFWFYYSFYFSVVVGMGKIDVSFWTKDWEVLLFLFFYFSFFIYLRGRENEHTSGKRHRGRKGLDSPLSGEPEPTRAKDRSLKPTEPPTRPKSSCF